MGRDVEADRPEEELLYPLGMDVPTRLEEASLSDESGAQGVDVDSEPALLLLVRRAPRVKAAERRGRVKELKEEVVALVIGGVAEVEDGLAPVATLLRRSAAGGQVLMT